MHHKDKVDDVHAQSYLPQLAEEHRTKRKTSDEKTRVNLVIARALGGQFLELGILSDGTDAVFGSVTGSAGRMGDACLAGDPQGAANRGAIHTSRDLSHGVDSSLKHAVTQTSGSYKGSSSKKTARSYDNISTITRLLKPFVPELNAMGLRAPEQDCNTRWLSVIKSNHYLLNNWAAITAILCKSSKGLHLNSNTEPAAAFEVANRGQTPVDGVKGAKSALRLLTSPHVMLDCMALDAAAGTAREEWCQAKPLMVKVKLMLDLNDGLLASDFMRIVHRLIQDVEHRLAGIAQFGIEAHPLNPLSSTCAWVDNVFDAQEADGSRFVGKDSAVMTREEVKGVAMRQAQSYLLNFRRKFRETICGPAGKFDLRQLFLGLLWGPTRKDAAKNIVDIRKKHPRTRFRCMHEDRKKARPWLWKIWTKHKATFFRLAGYTTLPALGRRRRGDGITQVTREATTEEIDTLLEDVEAALGGHFVGGKLIEITIKAFKAVAKSTHG